MLVGFDCFQIKDCARVCLPMRRAWSKGDQNESGNYRLLCLETVYGACWLAYSGQGEMQSVWYIQAGITGLYRVRSLIKSGVRFDRVCHDCLLDDIASFSIRWLFGGLSKLSNYLIGNGLQGYPFQTRKVCYWKDPWGNIIVQYRTKQI